jgi:hypothetical protein
MREKSSERAIIIILKTTSHPKKKAGGKRITCIEGIQLPLATERKRLKIQKKEMILEPHNGQKRKTHTRHEW